MVDLLCVCRCGSKLLTPSNAHAGKEIYRIPCTLHATMHMYRYIYTTHPTHTSTSPSSLAAASIGFPPVPHHARAGTPYLTGRIAPARVRVMLLLLVVADPWACSREMAPSHVDPSRREEARAIRGGRSAAEGKGRTSMQSICSCLGVCVWI